MEILVCIKQVPQTNKVEVDPVTGVLKRGGVASKMNPYDLYALETALRLTKRYGGRVKVLSMGPPQAEQVIREAFAMGAQEGVLLSDRRFGGADVLATSYTLSQGVRHLGHFDMILCGKQTTDGDTAQVGAELSEALQLPAVLNVIKILEINEGFATVEMDLGQEIQTVRVALPCLMAVEKDIVQPRLPSFVRKCQMADTPIQVLGLTDLQDQDESHYGLNGSPTQVQRIFPPESNLRRQMYQGDGKALATQLVALLEAQKLWQ
ncbi:MAG: electron transfer flavoprotein subunit beta/FixA family protein [Clostridia bacterium]